jgi:flagellar biosynthesis GTPase FlhF
MLEDYMAGKGDKELFLEVFRVLDVEQKGYLSNEEMMGLFASVGMAPFSRSHLSSFLSFVLLNKDPYDDNTSNSSSDNNDDDDDDDDDEEDSCSNRKEEKKKKEKKMKKEEEKKKKEKKKKEEEDNNKRYRREEADYEMDMCVFRKFDTITPELFFDICAVCSLPFNPP